MSGGVSLVYTMQRCASPRPTLLGWLEGDVSGRKEDEGEDGDSEVGCEGARVIVRDPWSHVGRVGDV